MPNRILTFILGMSLVLNLVLLLASDSVVKYILKKNPISHAKAIVKKMKKDVISTKLSAAKKIVLLKTFFRPSKNKKAVIDKEIKEEEAPGHYEELKRNTMLDLGEYLNDRFHNKPEIEDKVKSLLEKMDKKVQGIIDTAADKVVKKYGKSNVIGSLGPESYIKLAKEKQRARYELRKVLGKEEFNKLLDWTYYHNQNVDYFDQEGVWIDL
jgi:hypothetical protein